MIININESRHSLKITKNALKTEFMSFYYENCRKNIVKIITSLIVFNLKFQGIIYNS